jgi:pimeloyl-ACP methyl ester carboxylesterase
MITSKEGKQGKSPSKEERISRPAVSYITHVFVLIHGTFARGAAWTGDDSGLVKALREAYPSCKIFRFTWTGGNSHSDRLSAANELQELLKSCADAYPRGRIHLVGHSHGGNVALYALRDVSVAELVTSLVCISSPFIRCTGRDTGSLYVRLSNVIVALLITSVLLSCIYVGTAAGAAGLTLGLVMLAGNIAVYFAVNVALRRFGPKILQRLSEKQRAIVDRLNLGRCNKLVLVARVRRDEAALLLRSSYLVSRIPHLVTLAGLLVLFLVASAAVLWIFSVGPLAHKSVQAVYTNWFMAALVALATYGFVAAVNLVVRSHPLAFGWEGVLDGLLVDLNIGLTPDFDVVEKEFEIRRGFRLRHSALYADEIFIQLLPHWVRLADENRMLPSKKRKRQPRPHIAANVSDE